MFLFEGLKPQPVMLRPRLILIDGFPGAGKTTTAVEIGRLLQQQGRACRWYLEEDDPHPIACLDLKLAELADKLPPLWREFSRQAAQDWDVVIIESRLWQNTALFMYMSEYPREQIVELQRLVAAELGALSPVLVYLYQDDVKEAIGRLQALRDEQLLARDLETTSWYPQFRSRDLAGLKGWVELFGEWAEVAEELYRQWPFLKLRVANACDDWEMAYQQIYHQVKGKDGEAETG